MKNSALIAIASILAALVFVGARGGGCECRELTRIRVLLEQQAGVVCNEHRCLPAPTPTAPNGGPLE